ncbi:hypothetical protein A6B35_33100 (plasmid) [Mesorhizobium amorphae CCNWGS0123]|nr:hypothetical protein A6B35_33100 [Mesorhizobium amorphae CCNWGS0123]
MVGGSLSRWLVAILPRIQEEVAKAIDINAASGGVAVDQMLANSHCDEFVALDVCALQWREWGMNG